MSHTIHRFEIFDQELFDTRRTRVDVHQDNIFITWYEDECICSLESWGEHGPSDFDAWGFRIKYDKN